MDNLKNEKTEVPKGPPMISKYANWFKINDSEIQTIIDFAFIEPAPEGQPKSGIVVSRIIIPKSLAQTLGETLSDIFKKKDDKNEQEKTTKEN